MTQDLVNGLQFLLEIGPEQAVQVKETRGIARKKFTKANYQHGLIKRNITSMLCRLIWEAWMHGKV